MQNILRTRTCCSARPRTELTAVNTGVSLLRTIVAKNNLLDLSALTYWFEFQAETWGSFHQFLWTLVILE